MKYIDCDDLLVEYRDRVTDSAGKMRLMSRDKYFIYSYISGDAPMYYLVNNTMYELKSGDIVIIRPGVSYGGFKKAAVRYRRFYILFTKRMYEYLKIIDSNLVSRLFDEDLYVITPNEKDRTEYFELIDELRNIYQSEDTYKNSIMFSAFIKLLVMMSKFCEYSSDKSTQNADIHCSDTIVKDVINYINDNWANVMSISDVAENMHYSKNYLSFCFKSQMNIGINKYIVEKKLSKSLEMLMNGESVTSCAYKCGFGSASYFINLFRKKYGSTPKNFVNQMVK